MNQRKCVDMLLQGALLALAVSACSVAESRSELDALIADRAYNVQRHKLEHPAVTQLSYSANIQYPGVAIPPEKAASLKQQGWRQCERDKAQWEHFGDKAVNPPRLVHQNQMSFAKDGEFMVIAMRYLSALPSPGSSESKPDNAVQRVVILHYDLSVEEVRAQMAEFVELCK